MKKQAYITLKLFATLVKFTPDSSDYYPVEPGTSVRDLVAGLKIPEEKAKLIFIDGIRGELDSILQGGERIGIFPPVGGG
ncbi:MAG: MoaD/ThiS family protein [Proteobacteria bacterium]|nr:MoaD/ThiS family protein [Pseudomonadota bacterium]MBU1569014.1 MoaD/ThiS family protein [Pseudomonadota bacterium]